MLPPISMVLEGEADSQAEAQAELQAGAMASTQVASVAHIPLGTGHSWD